MLRATVAGTTTATFVKVAGQAINKITAKTTYAGQSLDFDATFEQPKRSLTAAGDVVLHPQHQEIHLRSLGVLASGMKWQTAAGTQPAIQYGGDQVTVKNLRIFQSDSERGVLLIEGSVPGGVNSVVRVTKTGRKGGQD